MEVLQQYFVQKQSFLPGDIVGAALPLYDEDQTAGVTTSQAIVLLKDARHGLLFRTMNEAELWEVVQEIRGQLEKFGTLTQHIQEFLKVAGLGPKPRKPWMHLVASAYRSLPSGLLPDEDGLADLPGADDDPIHRCIRRWQLSMADGVLLVVQKDFSSMQSNALDMLSAEKLLQPIADGTTSLMVVLSDHTLYGWDRMLDAVKWASLETNWSRREAEARTSLRGRLQQLNAEQGAQVAKKVPIVTVRALQFAGLMAALQKQPPTEDHLAAKMNDVLRRTGFRQLYWGLAQACRPVRALTCDVRVHTIKERMVGDLRLISNEDALDTLQRGLLDMIEPPKDVLRGLTDNIKQGAHNLEQLIVLMHRHTPLLTKYGEHTIHTFNTFNKELWSLHNFSNIRTGGRKVLLKAEGQPRWQEAVPQDFLPHPGRTVDVDGLCDELSRMVFGVAGQVRVGPGWEDIDPADGQQQAGIIKDMLVRQLLQTAVEELQRVPIAKWCLEMLGVSANIVLMEDSYRTNPWHALALAAVLTRNDFRVKVVSSRVLPNGSTPLSVGYEVHGSDGNYEGCRMCMQPARADENLVCCDGEHCSYAIHLEHLSAQERLRLEADPAKSWLCPTCQLRGRTV
ncbi:hypothetical protein WJX72_006198 [[Myrmecia] bisecta]|uniref:PHD-type domain-containing protein n=1 Tax=[Myrmecia] bisecta TaxID=41462 RepID=A0AAW1R782_9CHLO